jgi:hypothetical protein
MRAVIIADLPRGAGAAYSSVVVESDMR